jgi:hypothetical protein
MLPNKLYVTLATALSITVFSSPAVLAQTPCEFSATGMWRSCQNERKEEFNATFARCNSISDTPQRQACKALARTEFMEADNTCADQNSARLDVCDALGEFRYNDPLADDSIDFIDPDDIGVVAGIDNNPYVILETGHTHVLRAEEYDEDSDETSVEIIVVHATDEVREIEGVDCRVVVDVVVEPEWDEEEGKWEFTPIEVTDDWFAQDINENVYYCGEVARNYEDGILRDLDGSFEAGLEYAEGGDLTRAAPIPGDMHRQEYALGEAEDIVEYLSLDADPEDEGISQDVLLEKYQCATGGNKCLMTYDSSPLEPEAAEFKYYLKGTGFVLAAAIEDGEVNEDAAEWLVCSEDSLEAAFADGSDCGFDDFEGEGEDVREELLSELCDLHDEFCDDGE